MQRKSLFQNFSLLVFLLIIPIFSCALASQSGYQIKKLNQRELQNISALSESYGYIRYFYPNPTVKDFDWTKFLMYAVNKLENVGNDKELGIELQKLFSPICPNIRFTKDSMVTSTSIIEPPYYIMEHKGIGSLAATNQGKEYTSVQHVERHEDGLSFYKDMYNFRLKESLYILFPMSIKQLPIKTKSFVELDSAIQKIKFNGMGLKNLFKKDKNPSYFFMNPDYRIADIIIRRNIIQHFYPYFKEDHLDRVWDEECQKAIQEVSLCQGTSSYYDAICQLMSHVKDSHINVYPDFGIGKIGGYIPTYYPDINIGFVGDTCYVKQMEKIYQE